MIREGCITVDGIVGVCATQVRQGQQLLQLEKLGFRATRRLQKRPVFLQVGPPARRRGHLVAGWSLMAA